MASSFVTTGIFCHCQNHHSVGLQPPLPQNCLRCNITLHFPLPRRASLSLSLSLPTQPTPYLGYVIILFHSSVLSCSVPTHSPLPHKTTLFLLFLPLNSDILCWKSWLCCSPLCSSVILWIVLGVMLPCAKIRNFKLQSLISNHSYFLQQLQVCTRNYNNWTKSD